MLETIYVGIGIIGANIAFLVGYLAYILPENENCIRERQALLDSKLKTKIDKSFVNKSLQELIIDFLEICYITTRKIVKLINGRKISAK